MSLRAAGGSKKSSGESFQSSATCPKLSPVVCIPKQDTTCVHSTTFVGGSVNAGIVTGRARFPWNKQLKSAATSSKWHQFGHATQIQHKHEHQSKSNSTLVPSGKKRHETKRRQSVATFRQISQCRPFAGKHHHSRTNGPLWASQTTATCQ